MTGSSARHSKLVADIRLALGRERDLVLWHVVQGVIRPREGHAYFAGMTPGAADIVGILAPTGRWYCNECKTGRAVASEDQLLWGELVRSHGGFYCVVRSVDEARAALARARKGERE